MKKVLLLAALCICTRAIAQIPAYSADDIIAYASNKDTLYIINFWATWCAPCVQELPEFTELQKRYEHMPVKILLVSLDFKDAYPDKLALFLHRKRMTLPVAWLSDTDPNKFIPKLENAWEGSIPATLILHPGRHFRKFIEGSISEEQVSAIADEVLRR